MKIKIRRVPNECEQLVAYGRQCNTALDKLCAFLIAISPLLQHYKGLYENAGFTVLMIAFPILTLRFIADSKVRGYRKRNFVAIMPLILFELYTAVDHSLVGTRMLYSIFMVWVFICLAYGCINMTFFLRCAVGVVSLAAILLAVQYLSHYIFHYRLELRQFQWLVSQDVLWVEHLSQSAEGRLYRPAAFFMEPSHLFLYSFPLLCVLLLSPGMTRWRRNMAVVITVAMLMSTSGFSIVACVGLWGLYLLFYQNNGKERRISLRDIFSGKNLLLFFALIVLLVLAYIYVPVFQRSVNRIFTDTEGTNAISGRIRLAKNYITTITGSAVWFGRPNVAETLDFNLAGFFATYIKWGVIGLVLTYLFYGQGLFLLKKAYFWMTAIILVISFFTAHTHGTFYMLYYVVFLMNGYYEQAKPVERKLEGRGI